MEDHIRASDPNKRMVDSSLKVDLALAIPVFEGEPTLNDNPDEPGYIGLKDGKLIFYDGVDWQTTSDEAHTHAIADVTGLQAALDSKANLSGATFTGAVILNADPTAALGAATKSYVDNLVTGLVWKKRARVLSISNITLSGTQTINGVALSADDVVLVKGQTDQKTNGLYYVKAGAWQRTEDTDTAAELLTAAVLISSEDSLNPNTQWVNGNSSITLGTTNIVFNQIAGAGVYTNGTGISLSGNVFSISASYVGQASITTLGTITTGVWQGTAIANNKLANSTISGKALGTDLATLTFGTHFTGTSYNGSGSGVTLGIDATSANTAGTIVARDGSGNFTAGIITAALVGNASSATLAAITNDTSTNATFYPVFSSAISGNNAMTVSSTKLSFNPSTGMLTATGFTGALTGNASTATNVAGTGITGTTLASNVVTSSLISAAGGSFGTGAYATITNYALVGQTFYIGTTQIAINRASATLNLAGIGTLAIAGALSGVTTLDLSGLITSTSGNGQRAFLVNGATTGISYATIANTGGQLSWGINGSTVDIFAAGALAYSGLIGTGSNTAFQLFTNNIVRYSISADGNHDFKSGNITTANEIFLSAGKGIYFNNSTNNVYVYYNSGANSLVINNGVASGIISLGGAVTINNSTGALIGTSATFSGIGKFNKASNSTIGITANGTLNLGAGASGAGYFSTINFGYDGGEYSPAYIGFLVTSGSGNTFGELRFATRNSGSDIVPTVQLTISPAGTITATTLAGTGTRMVVADSAGVLSTQAIPSGGGGGSVTSIGIASSNGFAGTSDGHASSPTITLSTTISGLLKGNGTSISAATAGTDYAASTSGLATGILKNTTGTGVWSIAVAADFPTLNQSTTGSAATLTTPRAINGINFDGSAPITVTADANTLTGTTLKYTVVTSSLTSVATIGTGVWQGTAIADGYISSAVTWNAKQAALSGSGIVVSTTGTISYITDSSANWNTAYGWGNHASAGYATASSSTGFTNKTGNISQWTNDSGYITSSGSISGSAGSVSWTNVTGRPTALSSFTNDLGNYGGYLTAEADTLASVTARGAITSEDITVNTITATNGGFNSDLNYKTVISRDLSGRYVGNDISAFLYHWNTDKSKQQRIGYGAQEIEKLIPEAVYWNIDRFAVDYTQVHTLLIDENTKRIQALESEVAELKRRLGE